MQSVELVNILRGYSAYISLLSRNGKSIDGTVVLSVSVDRYHTGYDPHTALAFYGQELRDVAVINADTRGEQPIRQGRAKALPEAVPSAMIGRKPCEIHTLRHGRKCGCKYAAEWDDLQPGQVIVCCPVILTADGWLQSSRTQREYSADGNSGEFNICQFTPDGLRSELSIAASIDLYNKQKPTCREAEREAAHLQAEEYEENPTRALEDIRYGVDMLNRDPDAMREFRNTYLMTPEARAEFELLQIVASFSQDLEGWRKLALSFGASF